jgi:acyl transferase domain-containing protein
MVVLKRLDDALEHGDTIRCAIRHTAVGQDGKTSGMTVPNGDAQVDLIQSVYQSVGLNPCEIGYVEAHGTGTVAGDVTEIRAITKAFCEGRDIDRPLYVGSIKANVGHLESTSGLAGLLKAMLVLQKGMIPPTPTLETLKAKLDLKSANIKVPCTVRLPLLDYSLDLP